MMLFKPIHIILIREGVKTVTRRRWKRKMAKFGGIYPIQTHLFQPKSECHGFIRCTKEPFRQRLGDMTASDAVAEGGYTLEGFKRLWSDEIAPYDPNEEVWVCEFEFVGDDHHS